MFRQQGQLSQIDAVCPHSCWDHPSRIERPLCPARRGGRRRCCALGGLLPPPPPPPPKLVDVSEALASSEGSFRGVCSLMVLWAARAASFVGIYRFLINLETSRSDHANANVSIIPEKTLTFPPLVCLCGGLECRRPDGGTGGRMKGWTEGRVDGRMDGGTEGRAPR